MSWLKPRPTKIFVGAKSNERRLQYNRRFEATARCQAKARHYNGKDADGIGGAEAKVSGLKTHSFVRVNLSYINGKVKER
jgi:hypothetical protein